MKVFYCNDHKGFWPVGTASVIVAENEEQARELLKKELKAHGLNPDDAFTIEELDITIPFALILADGNY